ncbi:ankyrin repeat domain-containing protein [Gemmatimonas sp. UBA7669]|uniref:ankyrin repeat domain-containing protein n=1 Tax=Gemmatimonas sp. UBA7669 TaxID=1946568 RepID=UPI0025C2D44C|nr:ankyrin repeat domain-containing protein [Gemmatimonas sp. UBA7669]
MDEFFSLLERGDGGALLQYGAAHPELAVTDAHLAAALGRADVLRGLLVRDTEAVRRTAGPQAFTPLLTACASPLHGRSSVHDAALDETVAVLLAAGADPNARESRYGVSALYFVTGHREVPSVARRLLAAGATPNDGESVFHAAEHFHEAALALLLEYHVDLNHVGDWGNTPLYFLLRWFDIAEGSAVRRGFDWLLQHGANPNVRSSAMQETALHVAAWQGQSVDVLRALLAHGADVTLRRADGMSAWRLAARRGFAELAELLEKAGSPVEPLSPDEQLLAACGRGDASAARAAVTAGWFARLSEDDQRLLPWAASRGREDSVRACLAVGWPVDVQDGMGATALHWAAMHGRSGLVAALLDAGAPRHLRDHEHQATPRGWAEFGRDVVPREEGDYVGTLALL